MKIDGKVFLFFEQSGTFKREFLKIGIPAFDFDIQNNFAQTDFQLDIFKEIEFSFNGKNSIFEKIENKDLIIAFFPCVEFSALSQMWYSLSQRNLKKMNLEKKFSIMIEKNRNRAYLFEMLYKLVYICLRDNKRLIIENPWNENTYLKQNVFLKKPDLIDTDRTRRGDFFKKPTAYWFFNCVPGYGESFQKNKKQKTIINEKKAPIRGMCSEKRSMISSDYARNFIFDFILNEKQNLGQLSLF